MKQKQILNSILLLFLITLSFNQVLGDTDKEGKSQSHDLHETYYGIHNKQSGDAEFYIFNIDIKTAKIVIFTVQGITTDSEPEMYLTTDMKEWPRSPENSEYYTKSSGLAILYLTEEQIRAAQSELFTVGVKCPQETCSFKITGFTEHDVKMGMNDLRYIYVQEDMEYAQIDIKRGDNDNFLAEFELVNPFEVKSLFDVYINMDKSDDFPTQEKAQNISKGWGSGNGQGLVALQNGDICQDCSIKAGIVAKKGSIIRIQTYSYKDRREIEPFTITNDFSMDKQQKTFILDVKEARYSIDFSEMDLVFALVLFQGDTDIYVHENFCPEKTEDFSFSSELVGDDRIVITPLQRKSDNTKFCIRTASEGYSLFALNVYPLNVNRLWLPFDYPESGKVKKGEIINYKLNIDGQNSFKVSLNMLVKSGKPEIYVKQCAAYETVDECHIEIHEIKEKNSENLLWSSDDDFAIIEFEHDGKKCHADPEIHDQSLKTCTYVVAIYGFEGDATVSKVYDESSYVILASHDYFHTNLVENHPYHDYVEAGAINYYKFDLKHLQGTQKLKFEVTGLHGEVTMFASQLTEFPNIEEKQFQSFWNVITYGKKDLKQGYYFIGIQGDQPFNSYTLTVSVETKNNNQKSYYKILQNLDSEISFQSFDERAHFEFSVNPSIKEDIEVYVKPIEGKFHFYISNNKSDLPDTDDRTWNKGWQSSHKQVIIKHDDPKNIGAEKYYGVIIPVRIENEIDRLYKCKVSYQQDGVRNLQMASMEQLHINTNQVQHFRIEVFNHDSIFISKKVTKFDQSIVQIYGKISDQNIKAFPTEKHNNFVVGDFTPQTFLEDEIKKVCPFLGENTFNFFGDNSGQKQQCFLYLSVQATEETYFYIFIDKNTDKQMIFPDIGQQLSLPKIAKQDKYMRQLYMYLSSSVETPFLTFDSCQNGHTPKIYLHIQKLDFNSDKTKWNWPNPLEDNFNKNEQIIEVNTIGMLSNYEVDKELLEQAGCYDTEEYQQIKCALLVTILDDNIHNSGLPIVDITVSTGVRYLSEGEQVRSEVAFESIDYFEFNMLNEKTNEIIIEATVWNNAKVVLFAQQADGTRPVIKNNDTIRKTDPNNSHLVLKKENENQSLYGTYIVGVYGYQNNAIYSISFRTGGRKQFMRLEPGHPAQISLDMSHSAHLFYRPSSTKGSLYGFRVISTELVGKITVSASVIDFSNNDYVTDIEKHQLQKHFKQAGETKANYIKVGKKELNDLCTPEIKKCGIIITAFAETFTKANIVIQDEKDRQIYLPSNTIVNNIIFHKEFLAAKILSDTNVDLILHVYLGKITLNYQDSKNKNVSQNFTADYSSHKIQLHKNDYEQNLVLIEQPDTKKAIFTLQALTKEDDHLLHYGVPHQVYFEKTGVYKEFVIHTNPDAYSSNIEVTIQHKYLEAKKSKTKDEQTSIDIEFYFSSFSQDHQRVGTIDQLHFNENFLFILPSFSEYGQLTIKFKPRSTSYNRNFFITVSEKGHSQLLVPGLERRAIAEQGETHIYEILIPENMYSIVETTYCMGKTIFSAGDNLQQLSQEGLANIDMPKVPLDDEFALNDLEYRYLAPKHYNSDINVYLSAKSSSKSLFSLTPYLFHQSQKNTPLQMISKTQLRDPFEASYNSTTESFQFHVQSLWADYDEVLAEGWEIKSYYYKYLFSDSADALESISMCHARHGSPVLPNNYFFKESSRFVEMNHYNSTTKQYEIRQNQKYRIIFYLDKQDVMFNNTFGEEDIHPEIFIRVIGHANVYNKKTKEMQTFKFPYDMYRVDTAVFFEETDGISILSIFGIIILVILLLAVGYVLVQKYRFAKSGDDSSYSEPRYGNLSTKTSFVEMN